MNFSVRPIEFSDIQDIGEFLSNHAAEVFYIRSNIAKGGFRYEGKPYQAEYFIALSEGSIVGIISHNWIGSVQIFSIFDEAIPLLSSCLHQHLLLSPRIVDCFLGPEKNVCTLIDSLNIKESDLLGGHRVEKLFTLSLKNLISQGSLISDEMKVRQAVLEDAPLLSEWRRDFFVEVQKSADTRKTLERAQEEVERRIQEKNLYILEKKGKPVSYCGLGGGLKDWTIVGPVWTPLSERSKGYGRIVTAGSLLNARENGYKNAVLFTLNPYAEKAYRAVGFKEAGNWSVNFLLDKEKISKE